MMMRTFLAALVMLRDGNGCSIVNGFDFWGY